MATMLRNDDSTQKHLNTVRRHIRLCNHINGTEELVTNISQAYNDLKNKQADVLSKIEAKEDAYDDVVFQDGLLDNAVRTVFEKCKQYDRENIGQSLLKLIFPEEKYGYILKMNMTKEPDEVEEIKVRLEKFGDQHALFPLAADLQIRIDASRQAIQKLLDATHTQKMAEAEEKIAQATLRRQYENNYLDARKKFSRQTAEMLFPKTSGRKIISENPAVD